MTLWHVEEETSKNVLAQKLDFRSSDGATLSGMAYLPSEGGEARRGCTSRRFGPFEARSFTST